MNYEEQSKHPGQPDSKISKAHTQPNVKLLSVNSQSVVNDHLEKTTLRDITIECSMKDVDNVTLEGLKMSILGLVNELAPSDEVVLQRTSPTTWKYMGAIDLESFEDELTVILQSESTGDFGYVALNKADIEQYVSATTSVDAPEFIHDIITDLEDGPSLSLKLAVACAPYGDVKSFSDQPDAGPPKKTLVTDDKSKTADDVPQKQKEKHELMEATFIPPEYMLLHGDGISLLGRFRQIGRLSDLSGAIKRFEMALMLIPDNDPDVPPLLNDLALALLIRFEHGSDLAYLSRAIEHQQTAVLLTPEDHTNMPSMLNKLANSFHRRFYQTKDPADFLNSIEQYQKAIVLAPEGHETLPSALNGLGDCYLQRFEELGTAFDLSNAIEQQQKSVALTPENHAELPRRLTSLGNCYRVRYEQAGDLADISNAIDHQQKAIKLTPSGATNVPGLLNSLGNSYLARFEQTSDFVDISRAMEHYEKAVMFTSDDDDSMPVFLGNLGNAYGRRFEKTGDLDDISSAIELKKRAIALTPKGHGDTPGRLNDLARLYMQRFRKLKDKESCKAAFTEFHAAAVHPSGLPFTRLRAAVNWADAAIVAEDPVECFRAYTFAAKVLPLVIGLHQTVQHGHTSIQNNGIAGHMSQAVGVAVETENFSAALEWAEQGRCLVWTQLSQLRNITTNSLQALAAPLANRLVALSTALETSGMRPESSVTTFTQQVEFEDQLRSHLNLSQEWGELLTMVRNIPDLRNFHQPRTAASILPKLPTDGPIVIINVDKRRCDALILIPGAEEIFYVPLENLTLQKAEKLSMDLRHYLIDERALSRHDRGVRRSRNPKKNDLLRFVLRELWNDVVKPILDGLGYSSPPAQRNRIWWCPTGPLSFLPIHAAGIYGSKARSLGMCISDYAISSYTPSVNTLLEKIEKITKAGSSPPKILLISQPETPGQSHIPATIDETRAILNDMNTKSVEALLLEGEEATMDRTVKELTSHQWVHFACHASQNTAEPVESGFYLHDGQLKLMSLIKQQLPAADFAFLSACQTSVGDAKLSNEAVHLAAGMLSAGFQGVVGTMWSIGDAYAPRISGDFYGHLLKEKTDEGSHWQGLDSRGAANALDHAIRKIRENLGDDEQGLLTWVPYVHYGL